MRLTCFFILLCFWLPALSQDQDTGAVEGPVGMTSVQFESRINRTSKPLLVYFSAGWCVVCKRQRPILDQVMAETGDQVELLVLDMENNPDIAAYFEVDALPVLILYKNGYMVWNRVGLQEKNKIMEQLSIFLRKK